MYSACTLSFLSSCVTVVPLWSRSLMHGWIRDTLQGRRRSSLACNGTSASCPVESSQGEEGNRSKPTSSVAAGPPARPGLHGLHCLTTVYRRRCEQGMCVRALEFIGRPGCGCRFWVSWWPDRWRADESMHQARIQHFSVCESEAERMRRHSWNSGAHVLRWWLINLGTLIKFLHFHTTY